MPALTLPQTAQSTLDYALLVACIAVLILLGGATFGAGLAAWFSMLVLKITSTLVQH